MKTPWLALIAVWIAPLALAAGHAPPGPLVDASWLAQNLTHVTVIDVRDDFADWTQAPELEKDAKSGQPLLLATGGHIHGALPLPFKMTRIDRMVGTTKISNMLPDRAAWQALMQATGVRDDRPIVVTSPGEFPDQIEAAARVYWTLYYYGAKYIALLDGGNAAWINAGLPISTQQHVAAPGDWQAGTERSNALAQISEVDAALRDGTQTIDARPLAQYLGLTVRKPAVTAGGHLQGATSFPTELRFRNVGGAQMFLSAAEYRALYSAQHIDAAAPAITYCNTGHMASGMWFIHSQILGNQQARLYDGSMHEWTTLGRPVIGFLNP